MHYAAEQKYRISILTLHLKWLFYCPEQDTKLLHHITVAGRGIFLELQCDESINRIRG